MRISHLAITGLILLGLSSATLTCSQKTVNGEVQSSPRARRGQRNRPPQKKPASNGPLTARQIVERVFPSIVLVVAKDENGEAVGQASGFFYKPGLVVTNLHVFTRASQASIKVLTSGTTYQVIEVTGINMRRDLCVLRIDDASTPSLTLNASAKPAVGDDVYVAGNPKGLEGSFSRGIVSGIRTDAGLIQMDAPISPGSSGGPVVNARAEVVGIAVSSIVGGQNLNFAVPVEYLASLKLNFRVPIVVAGAFSLKDREKDKLKGLVQSVSVTQVSHGYDERNDRVYEKPAQPVEQSKYDLDGNKIERWFYLDGVLFGWQIYIYDEEGFKTRMINHSKDGSKKEYELTRAESMSEKLEKRMFSGVEETQISTTKYDRNGNEIETQLKNPARWKTVYRYDKNGFVAEEKFYTNDQLQYINRYTYETDEHGNWTKQSGTNYDPKDPESGLIPAITTYREITYY